MSPRSDEGDVKPGGGGGGGGPGRGPGRDGDKPDDDKKPDEKKPDDKKPGDEKPADEKKDEKKDEDKKDDEKKDGEGTDKPEKKDGEKGDAAKKPKEPSIDVEGIGQRILALPLPSGSYEGLACGKDVLYYVARGESGGPRERGGTLFSFEFETRKPKEVLKGVSAYEVAAGGAHLLVLAGGSWQITDPTGKNEKRLGVDDVQVRVEPEKEWRQMLRDAWRIERDYFYDPQMHGVDWPAMWERYSAFLPHVHHRSELNFLIGEMIGELACGHEYVSGGQTPAAPKGAEVGLLGADLATADGRWRLSRIYRGQNWTPSLRGPLTEPGVDAREGDYLVSVNGRAVSADDEPYAAFEGTADRQTEIVLSAKADGSEPRTMTVVPLDDDRELRRRAWVEDNRRKVDEMSKGRLAYVYMPDTGGAGLAAFERDFYAQLGKEGLVLDERYNGGGKIADSVIERLSRNVLCHWVTRDGWAGRTPFGSMPGPKAMIVNQLAGSGGDALPWMFKKLKLGPIVGVRTWGGLVGISGYPPLMDGGSVTAAAFGIMDTDGRWVVENEGVAPDHEVFEHPKECLDGRDPQLEKAVALVLEALERTPPPRKPPVSPPAPR
jgi:tricorn protease